MLEAPGDKPGEDGLWAELASGRPEAFARFLDSHGAQLLAHALAVTGDRALAEDALQDVLLLLVERPAIIQGVANPPGYVARMVRNRAIDLLRRRTRTALDEAALTFIASPPGGDGERIALLNGALARLPQEQREVVVLKIIHGLTFSAIAEATGTTLNTAASRYRYALEKLALLLEDMRHDP